MSRANTARDFDAQTFLSPLIDQGQTFEPLTVGAAVVNEVVRPQVVGRCRWGGTRPARGDSPSRATPGHLKARLAPQPLGPGPHSSHTPGGRETLGCVDTRIGGTDGPTIASLQPPVRLVAPAHSPLFFRALFYHVNLKVTLSYHLLQRCVLLLELAEPTNVGHLEFPVALTPRVDRLFTHSVAFGDLRNAFGSNWTSI